MIALNSPHGATRRTPCSQSAPRSRRRRRPHFCPGCCPPLSHNSDGRRTHTHAFVRHAIRLRRPLANTRMGDSNLDGRAGADGSLVRSLLFVCMRKCNRDPRGGSTTHEQDFLFAKVARVCNWRNVRGLQIT
jgi:hypothetical protein